MTSRFHCRVRTGAGDGPAVFAERADHAFDQWLVVWVIEAAKMRRGATGGSRLISAKSYDKQPFESIDEIEIFVR
jgi:hypothetical protein